ncbi:MAG: class I SAM-dependent methyltransferase [Solirubrobacteraceae bacterium]
MLHGGQPPVTASSADMSLNQETGRDRYFAARERELALLLDPATGMLADRYAKTVPCPLCGSKQWRTLFIKHGFTFVRCAECRLVFSNPQVRDDLVETEYRSGGSNDIWVEVLLSERQLEIDRSKFSDLLDELEPVRGEGRLLDVGCSIGLFLELARSRGWSGVGIEFSDRARTYAVDALGLDVVATSLESTGWRDASFDVITLNSVIEHLNDPRRVLGEVRRLLKPRGALYLITPNVESLACRLLHEQTATFDGRNHLVYFSAATLTRALEAEGFRVQSMSTHIASLQPMLEWLASETPYSDTPLDQDAFASWLEQDDRRAALEDAICASGLGYKLHSLATAI